MTKLVQKVGIQTKTRNLVRSLGMEESIETFPTSIQNLESSGHIDVQKELASFDKRLENVSGLEKTSSSMVVITSIWNSVVGTSVVSLPWGFQ
jgi:hypothetical protein